MKNGKVTIIDYGMGNLYSVLSAFHYMGCEAEISDSPIDALQANAIVLPGVGSFRQAMLALQTRGLDQAILTAINQKGAKILGICLGMQLMAMSSTEDGATLGLGLIPAHVDRFDSQRLGKLKVPHVGFNQVFNNQSSHLFSNIQSGGDFYFVHSYRLLAEGLDGYHAICNYGEAFLAGYEHKNVFATQFHPEKSQSNGLQLLKNFLDFC
jgi:glutamine amidotransferase